MEGSQNTYLCNSYYSRWRYSDESSNDGDELNAFDTIFSHKRIVIEGMTLFTDLFRISPFSGHTEESTYRSTVDDMVRFL